MTLNLQAKKEEADRIKALLTALPQYESGKALVGQLRDIDASNEIWKAKKKELDDVIKGNNAHAEKIKTEIKALLEEVEAISGYTNLPGVAHLRPVAESYQVKDEKAVPDEYFVTEMVKSLDKKKLNTDITLGIIDKESNWLEVTPATRTVVIKD